MRNERLLHRRILKALTKRIVFLVAMSSGMLLAQNTTPPPASTLSKLHIKGDVRFRDKEIQRDDKDNSYDTQYRARVFVDYELSDTILFESSISSGKGNPTSGNINFGEGIKGEIFQIDILDIAYKSEDTWLRAGRSQYFFYRPIKTQLIWDNDLRPEGLSYGLDTGDKLTAAIWKVHRLENEATSTGDIYMFVGQYMHPMSVKDKTFNIGGGFYYYDGVKGNSAPYANGPLGNSVDANNLYTQDYAIAEGFGEILLTEVEGQPIRFATILAYNAAAKSHNFGYDLRAELGEIKHNLDWKIAYSYRNIQKDAVFGAHNDSDFLGGGTDGRGHVFLPKMQINKNMDIGGHFQFSKLYTDSNTKDSKYRRMHLDVMFKF